MRRFAVGVVAAVVAGGSVCVRAESVAPPSSVSVKPLASAAKTASGQPIVFPQGDGRVVVSEYVIAPGAKLPVHRHRYPRVAYVLQGKLQVTDTDTGQDFSYKAGDVVVEVVDQRHFGRNDGDEPVRLIVFDTLPVGVQSNVVVDDP